MAEPDGPLLRLDLLTPGSHWGALYARADQTDLDTSPLLAGTVRSVEQVDRLLTAWPDLHVSARHSEHPDARSAYLDLRKRWPGRVWPRP